MHTRFDHHKETSMEYRLWKQLYEIVICLGKTHCFKGKRFADAWIVLTYLWASLHDRPVSWACDPINWPALEQWHALPSNSTMSRRLRTISVQTLMEQAQAAVRDQLPRGLFKMIDAKSLPVSGVSKDPDANYGRGAGGMSVGYKCHMAWDMHRVVDAWQLSAMSDNEKVVAPKLIDCLDGFAYAVCDNQYDSTRLFDLTAARGGQLLVRPRKSKPAGLGHRVQSPNRLRSLEMNSNPLADCGERGSFGQDLMHARDEVERCFGTLGNFAGGMGPLPNWVRRPRRVARWIWSKLLIYHVRMALKQGLM
jgi:hypothetical protein